MVPGVSFGTSATGDQNTDSDKGSHQSTLQILTYRLIPARPEMKSYKTHIPKYSPDTIAKGPAAVQVTCAIFFPSHNYKNSKEKPLSNNAGI
jgi:hypothetical protein